MEGERPIYQDCLYRGIRLEQNEDKTHLERSYVQDKYLMHETSKHFKVSLGHLLFGF